MALICSPAQFNNSKKEVISENSIYDELKELSETTGYSITQRNGQRIYGPPPNWTGEKPPKGSEIFVGKIPRDVFENELVPIFESVGKIYELRLMMDFSGYNRGFCFVTYCNIESADEAVQELNEFELRPQKRLGVYKSVDNCRLFLGGLPRDKQKEELLQALKDHVEGITNVILYSSQYKSHENRGFAFVEFENHRYAAMARRQLALGALQLWGIEIVVDWADPLPTLDPNIMAQVTNLYIRNICVFMPSNYFLEELAEHIPDLPILKIHKVLDYAFVHFKTRNDAEKALNILNGVIVNGHKLEVSWARPKMYSKTYRLNSTPTNFCTSLPPRMRRQVKAIAAQIRENSRNRNQSLEQNLSGICMNPSNFILNHLPFPHHKKISYENDHSANYLRNNSNSRECRFNLMYENSYPSLSHQFSKLSFN